MTITLSPTQLAWVNLPSEQKDMFNNIAYKDGNPDLDGYDWFEHLVPEAIQSSPEKVEVFMNGGTVTDEVWVHDQGMANGHYEQVSYDIADKDVSRITSGANGGEYTPDNTVMEDASANRARGAEDMSSEELDNIQEMNAFEADILESGEVLTDIGESAGETVVEAAPELLGAAGDLLADAMAPAIGAYMAADAVSKQCKTTEDKIGYGALAAGGAALVCMTPVGQAGLALYAGTKLTMRVLSWMAPKPDPKAAMARVVAEYEAKKAAGLC